MLKEEDIGESWQQNVQMIVCQYILCTTSLGVAGHLLASAIEILDIC